MVAYQDRWAALIAEVKANVGLDPAGEKAQDMGRRWTALLDEVYGGHPELKTKIAAAYSAGAIPKEHNIDRSRGLGLHQEGPRGGRQETLV